jgi:hypothetical protein
MYSSGASKCVHSFIHQWLYSPLFGPGRFFSNPVHSRVDSLDEVSARRMAATYTQNKRTQTPMPRVGFESTILAFERGKTVHALDRAATVMAT